MNSVLLRSDDLSTLFGDMARLKVGIIGDFALDLYIDYYTQTGESSLETGLDVHWGGRPRASLGAAGNVLQNLLALGVTQLWAIGCVGPDLFGREMRHLMEQQGVQTNYLLMATSGWDTCVYTKPMQGQTEANRIDFGSQNVLPDNLFDQLLDGLAQLLPQLDVLVINQQFRCPLLTPARIHQLNTLIRQYPSVYYVADLRHTGSLIQGTTLKLNTAELACFQQTELPVNPNLDWCCIHGIAFARHLKSPVVLTRGEAGMLYITDAEVWSVDGLELAGPLDTVGAGDTVVAALALSLSAGASPPQALLLANLAAAVTVQKLGQTGTATPNEIGQLFTNHPIHGPTNYSTLPPGAPHAPNPATASVLDKP